MIAAKATKSSNEPMSNAKVSRLSGMNITAKSTAPTSRYSTANPRNHVEHQMGEKGKTDDPDAIFHRPVDLRVETDRRGKADPRFIISGWNIIRIGIQGCCSPSPGGEPVDTSNRLSAKLVIR